MVRVKQHWFVQSRACSLQKNTVLGENIPNRKLLAKIGYMRKAMHFMVNLNALENSKFFADLMGLKNGDDAINHAAENVSYFLNKALVIE